MPQYKYVQVGFTDDTLEQLDDIANERDESRSEIVREAVEEYTDE